MISLLFMITLIFKGIRVQIRFKLFILLFQGIGAKYIARQKWHYKGKDKSNVFTWNAAPNHPSLKSKAASRLTRLYCQCSLPRRQSAERPRQAPAEAHYFPSRLRARTINNSAASHYMFVHWRRRKIPYFWLTPTARSETHSPGACWENSFLMHIIHFSYHTLQEV